MNLIDNIKLTNIRGDKITKTNSIMNKDLEYIILKMGDNFDSGGSNLDQSSLKNLLVRYNINPANYQIFGKIYHGKKTFPKDVILISNQELKNQKDFKVIGKYKDYFIWKSMKPSFFEIIVTKNNFLQQEEKKDPKEKKYPKETKDSESWSIENGKLVSLVKNKNPWFINEIIPDELVIKEEKKENLKENFLPNKKNYLIMFLIIFSSLLVLYLIIKKL